MITQIFVNWLWSLKSTLKKYSTNIVHSHNTNRITYSMIQILQIYIKNFYRQLSKYSQRWQIRYTVSYHLFSFNHPQNYIPRWRSDKNRNNDRRSKRKWTRYLDDRINDVTRKRGRCGARLVELNFTRIFTWPQYFIGHLMPGHVLLSLSGEGGHLWIKAPRLKISFSYRG